MKSRLWVISVVCLAGWLLRQAVGSYCSAPFQDVPYSTGYYCAKCDTTCLTCLGSAINQCSTCPQDFTLNANSSTCASPINASVDTIANQYHSFNFITEWNDTTISNCGTVTLIRPLSPAAAVVTTHVLPAHYQIRVRVAFWTIVPGSSGTMGFKYSDLDTAYEESFISTATINSNFLTQSYNASCEDAYALNYEKYINDSTHNPQNVEVRFTSSAASWGVNQYIFIVYKCSQPDCASCSGPSANQCFSCSDANKALYVTPGTCQCSFELGYYAYPTGNSTYFCVNPCPNLPSGQYYGDNSTKSCVLTCPVDATNTARWGLSFASDVDNLCVKECWASISLGGAVFPLYYDLVGRKCTTQCPSGQPYANPFDSVCYENCPNNGTVQFYNLDLNYSCVITCPDVTNSSDGTQIPLYKLKVAAQMANGGSGFIYVCVEACPASPSRWGYTDSNGIRECVEACPNRQFTDLSTGRRICREVCAAPDWFGSLQGTPSCGTSCSFEFYGDQNDPAGRRECVKKCNGSYYGIKPNGKCVEVCPDGTWGEILSLTCVAYPSECNARKENSTYNLTFLSTVLPGVPGDYSFNPADGLAFADSYTRRCVWANESCSMNMYKLNSSLTCEIACPDGTYAHPLTFWCVDRCYGVYFADYQLDRCVLVCSPGLFADRGSGNACVTSCNQTGGYPFRDADRRQCVDVCSNGYADPIAQSCVFNCTPGLYLNGSDQSNQAYKVCAFNCSEPYFAYNNTDSGICLQTCPANPVLFGDTVGGLRICVEVCQLGSYGDQTNNSYRHCVADCPNNTFAQGDSLRRCVARCNSSTFGRTTDWTCVDPLACPDNFTGDPTTNLCVDWCPTANGTFADNISKLCVSRCPNDNGTLYYADAHLRWCIPTCRQEGSTVSEFGNNSTQTCEASCLDNNSYADAQSPRRYCIALCTNTASVLYYRNNFTMSCVVSTGCPSTYFGDNLTASCVRKCPRAPTPANASLLAQSWGYHPTKTCVALCLPGTFGDSSSGIPLCVSLCAEFPVPKWAYKGPEDNLTVMLCESVCPEPFFGEDFLRTCVTACPREDASHPQTYAFEGTRRCVLQCPSGTFADYIEGVCYHSAINCTLPCWYNDSGCSDYRWGNPFNSSCTYLCTASPWDTYGDNTTQTCTTRCAPASYADNYTGSRTCIATCPGYYDEQGVVNSSWLDIRGVPLDSYGDNFTQRCVQRCITASTYADWQSHVCTLRCSGDLNSSVPTYANIFTKRCVVSLFCPVSPDLYFGENTTRLCQPSCLYSNSSNGSNGSGLSFADNITRACIPVCYEFYNATLNVTTRFYGDVSTTRPACVIACPVLPRLFGRNDSNRCVEECPDYQYGDQTGNRSCVAACPKIGGLTWFSQLTERICVLVCENGTWGNYFNSTGPHCETVPTDCKPEQFADNSTHLCVDLCPESMNYFGDPSTRLCTTSCPLLAEDVNNGTAAINLTAGRLFADYKTRLCVYTCPADFGLQGTFGDNSTNTCVERCPAGTYGDANTTNRYCVANCSGGAYADPLSMLCVEVCPASPPSYGYEGNWSCLRRCPSWLWADDATRKCVSSCEPGYRLSTTGECVGVCPAELDLYGDSNGFNCTPVCTLAQYADPHTRTCRTTCGSLFEYNYRCVLLCPQGLFANSTGNCVPPLACDGGTFGDNSTTECVSPCPAWSFADSLSGYCIAICPAGTYGQNHVCQSDCSLSNTSYSNITQQCMSTCPNGTYSLAGACVTNCTGDTYQREDTRVCDDVCGAGLWADPTSHRCVKTCPFNWFRQLAGARLGFCVPKDGGCAPYFADFYTGNCVARCSSGFWGFGNSSNSTDAFLGNYTCLTRCPAGLFGYASASERTCYPPKALPVPGSLFADGISGQFVAECPEIPLLYFGDANRQTCVAQCQAFNLSASVVTLFYGDPQVRQCKSSCSNSTYSADNATRLCSLKCSLGTFRYNNTPVCVSPCFEGYGDYSTRICVAKCPAAAGTFGFYNASSGSRLCLRQCPPAFFAEPIDRTCTALCPDSPQIYYAYNGTGECLLTCKNNSFADNSNRRCVERCLSSDQPNADNSTNTCVFTCPSEPDYYADDHVCVFYCVSAGTFADPNGRVCRSRCSNVTNGTANQYGDPRTGRCVVNCSEGSWADNSTNLCVETCPDGSFADNTTGKCVAECPKVERIYADMVLHVCAATCSHGRWGSQVNQTCVEECDEGFWGDPTTTLCTARCPVKIYSYGQNRSRTCVGSCSDYSGYADNHSRLCREYCQHTLPTQTYIDYATHSCVQICPQGSWAVNHTAPGSTINECALRCPAGFADNSSQWCVAVCPSDPESYGDTHDNICIYSCRFGEFSDNSTNLCVEQCPSPSSSPPADYFGDPLTGRCVLWCTEGTFAQEGSRRCVNPCDTGEFADNLTRRCVSHCPPDQATFADSTTHRCVRICPVGLWAENTTQACVEQCWTYSNGSLAGVVGYADNETNFCVSQCPFGYFGTNGSHRCVPVCPASLNEYGHFVGRVCVGTDPITHVVDCYPDNVTGEVYYADNTTQTCVQKCPLGLWADTHLQKCVPDCDASFPEFRNTHTQMCVSPCPSEPDEFGDPLSGDCVRTCPPGSYAYTDNRTCLEGCGAFQLFADNTTNRCVSRCATLPFLYADNLTDLCVLHCSGGWFADNRSQTCVPVCPAEWAYFGELQTFTCVSLCPEGQFADASAGRTCRSTCSSNLFSDNFTSSCVEHCRFVRPFWYEDTSLGHGVCVAVCPGESYAFNPDQTCRYQNASTLASTCPPPYFADRASRQCLKLCPAGTFADSASRYCETACAGSYFADPVLRRCALSCSGNLFEYVQSNSSNQCVQYCPSPLFAQNSSNSSNATAARCVGTCEALGLPSTRTCEGYCPYPYFADWDSHLCVNACAPLFKHAPSRSCLQTCLAPYYGNTLTGACELLCPPGRFGRNDTRRCDSGCPNGSFADPSIRICVGECPGSPLLYADARTNQCLDSCASPLFGYGPDRTCRPSCPTVNVTNGSNETTLVFLADASNRLCVLACVNALVSFADYARNECTQLCPNGTFANNFTKECVGSCPRVPRDTFSDNSSRVCMDVCLPGSFGMAEKLNCVAECWWPFFADTVSRRCVDICPAGSFAVNSSASCRPTCPELSFADPVTRRCLATCPALQLYFNFAINWTCLLSCPTGFFASTATRACESICNSSVGMFAYLPTGQCVQECPVPTRGFAPNFTCVTACPALYYYYDVTINVCALCDPTCVVCSSLTSCLECRSGYNLFSGYCTRSCLPADGVVTYADPDGLCVRVCPAPYFGENASYSCNETCPTSQFGDAGTRLCQYCPPTCASCSSLTTCLTCAPAATLAIDGMCYRDCNATFKYAFNGSCFNVCPPGSFLTYTGVTCAACGPLCLTCAGAPTVCTSCSATYFYNSSCTTSCPQGFYGSSSLQCLSCAGSAAAACSTPLNFSTSFSTQNYQPVITLQFNQNVSMSRSIEDILKINLNLARLLREERGSGGRQLSLGTIVNNGITYTYEILSNGTIKLYPQIGTSLLNPTFSIQISDPTAITSTSTGVTLQNVQSLLSIAALEYYPAAEGEEAGTNFPAKLVTVLVLVLYGVTFLFSDVMVRPLQWLQLFLFHCLIAAGVPANLYYHLLQMKASTLHFITNWFSASLPALSPYYTTPQKVADVFTDEIFLRHLGQFLVLLVVLGCFWFVFLILSSKHVMRHKVWQGFFEEVSRKRYQLMVLNDAFSAFYFPLIYFALMQMPNLLASAASFYALNAALTLLLFAAALALPIAWTVLWKLRSREEVRERLWFLTLRIKPLAGERQAAVHGENSVELKEKSSRGSDLYEPAEELKKEDRNPRQLESVVFLWYQTLMALWMVALYSSPTAQLALLLATNAVFLFYHLRVRPQLNVINLVFTVAATLFLMLFEALYLYFLSHSQLTASQKTAAAHPFLIAADIFCVLFALWAVWRVVWECSFYWGSFKRTQLYLEFADHDYVGEEEKASEYSLYEKKAEVLEVGLGDLVIDEIIEKVGAEGERIIAVRKKRLRKKGKAAHARKKKDGAELLPEETQREEYVRINQVNIFDYHDQFEEEPKMPEPQPRRRAIDDDLRDILSENSDPVVYREEEEEEKKIDMDPEDELLGHLDSISAVHQKLPSERLSEFPFIEAEEEQRMEEEKMGEEEEAEAQAEAEQIEAKPESHFYPIERAANEIPAEGEMESEREGKLPERGQEMESEQSNLPLPNPSDSRMVESYEQLKSEQEAIPSGELPPPQESKPQEEQSINVEALPDESELAAVERPKIKNIEDLLAEEESGKKKNLLFLFDDFEEEDN